MGGDHLFDEGQLVGVGGIGPGFLAHAFDRLGIEPAEIGEVITFMLTRPRGVTIRDVVLFPTLRPEVL